MNAIVSERSIGFISPSYRIDRKLYKYYSNIDYAIDCIKNKRIHLDDPSGFNDPFDGVFNCGRITLQEMNISEMEMFNLAFKYVALLPPQKRSSKHSGIIEAISNLLDQSLNGKRLSVVSVKQPVANILMKVYDLMGEVSFGFADFAEEVDLGYEEAERVNRLDCRMSCFSEVNDSILMWSYYSKNHEGVCLEFDLSKLNYESALNKEIFQHMTKVHYSPIRADIQYSCMQGVDLNFLTTKADVWSHEHEWRLICETEEEYLPFDCVSAIYMGVRFGKSTKYIELMDALDEDREILVYRAKMSLAKYELEFENETQITRVIRQWKKRAKDGQ